MKFEYNPITAKASLPMRLGQKQEKRDDVSFLEGRVLGATGHPFSGRLPIRLAGSQSEAQPPGARMAVRKKTLTRCVPRVKACATTCGGLDSATSEPFRRIVCSRVYLEEGGTVFKYLKSVDLGGII